MLKRRVAVVGWLAVLAAVLGLGAILASSSSHNAPNAGLATNTVLDDGQPLSGRAPDFTLTDQFGQHVSLRSFRGRAVILAFNDSQCTTVCPLTTTAMVEAKQLLGAAGSRVQLLGVDANPQATAVKDVRAYSQAHGMLHQWRFLTAGLPQLKRVWKAYHIGVQILSGEIDHTPALFVISPQGNLEKLYVTQMSYASVPQLGQLVAQNVAGLLPGHPQMPAKLSYAQAPSIGPTAPVSLPRAGGGTVRLGRGEGPRLQMFFATWDSQVLPLRTQLEALNQYQSASASAHLPPVVAVDEGSVEPSPAALTGFLAGLSRPLSYPVGIDASGRVADGYQVQDQPWFVLTSRTGRIIWYYDVATQGSLTAPALRAAVRAALRAPPKVSLPATGEVPSSLAGSPPPLAALHLQAGRLLGSEAALAARLRGLRGYPVVINAWASWCAPCRTEFPLFASAAARYGRRVAFLGVDTNDSSGDAASFLTHHAISYPSYQSAMWQLSPVAPVADLPTTIFLNAAGKTVNVHTGEYAAQGTLDQDIAKYAG